MNLADFGYKTRISSDSFDAVVDKVTAALKEQGFGVLTEIDVKATMKKKLDVDFSEYKILGACNPPLAHKALSAAPAMGLLLPCNVVVRALDDGGFEVNAVKPSAMFAGFVDDPALSEVADAADAKLKAAIDALA